MHEQSSRQKAGGHVLRAGAHEAFWTERRELRVTQFAISHLRKLKLAVGFWAGWAKNLCWERLEKMCRGKQQRRGGTSKRGDSERLK